MLFGVPRPPHPYLMTRWRTFMRRVLPPAFLLLLALAQPAPAEVKPHALFTDGMVLQPKQPPDKVEKEINAKWEPCTPQTIGKFSAVAYHFGVELQKVREVPIGLIHSSWGGTICEAWATKESLSRDPELKVIWDR